MSETTKVIRIVVDSSKARSGSEETRQALKRMEDQTTALHGASSKLGAMFTTLKASLVGFLSAFVSERLFGFVKDIQNAVGGLGELAEQVGINVRALQALQYSAAQAGVSAENLDGAISKFGAKIGDAVQGNDEAIKAFDRLGIKLLDSAGKLRATESILGEVAYRLEQMEDPALKAAAAKELFGKSGQKLIPMLRDLAGGMDSLISRAKAAGVVIEQETIDKLDKLSDRAEVASLKWRKFSADIVAPIKTTALDLFGNSVTALHQRIINLGSDWSTIATFLANPLAGISKLIGTALGGGISTSLAQSPKEQLDAAVADIAKYRADIEKARTGGQADNSGYMVGLRGKLADAEARRDRLAMTGIDVTWHTDAPPTPPPGGVRNPLSDKDRAGGERLSARVEDAKADARLQVEASRRIAEAAKLGEAAVRDEEIAMAAAKKARDAYGDSADKNADKVALLAEQLRMLNAEAKRQDTLRGWELGNRELERTNELLEAEVRLVGASDDARAREIAQLKVRQQALKEGLDVESEVVRERMRLVEQNEKLTAQIASSKREAELWAEPFKNAIQSVQSTMTDLFEKLFNGSIKGFSDLAAAGKAIWFRLMAEMASVAVIRPVIQFAVGGASSLGLIGPQTAQAFGVSGGGGSGGGAGSSLTSGGGFNPFGMFGSGGLSGALGSVGTWLNTPIGFNPLPAGMTYGPLAPASNGLAGSFLGNVTPMQGLGALAGIGSSIFSFANGNPIGGAAGLLGAGLSFVPGMQWAAPIVGILGSVLGGLFKKEPNYAAQGFHSYNAATGRYGARVGFEENMKAPLAPGVGNDALKLISAFGGSVAPGMSAPEYYIWRGFKDGRMDATVTAEGSPTYKALLEKVWASGQIRTTDEAQWAARTELWTDSPVNGEWTPLPVNSLTGDSDKLMQQLALLILKAGVRDGSFTGLSDTSQRIIRNYPEADTKGLGEALQWGKSTYDQLVRTDTITAAEKAFTDLRDSFQAAILKAEEYRLATDKLTEAKSRALNKYASDFGRNIEDQLLGIADPAALQRLQIEREREQALKEWDYLQQEFLKGNISTLIERNKVQQLYDEKLKSILGQTLASLENFERRVRFGDLSAANPLESLAGTLGAYKANAAQALTGNATAINQYEAFAEAAIRAQAAYGGNDYAAADLRRQILEEIAAIQGRGGAKAANGNEMLLAQEETNRLLRELLDRMQAA